MATKRSVELLNYQNEVNKKVRLGTLLDDIITKLNGYMTAVVPGGSAAVAIATTASRVRTGASVVYMIGGVSYTLASTDNFWTLTGANLADGYTRKYLLLVDAAGAASVLASNDRLTASAAGCVFPSVPSGKAVLGVVQVDTAGAVFIPGTTLLSAGTVVDTYTNGRPAGVVVQTEFINNLD